MKKRFYIERTAAIVCAIVALLPAVQTFGQSAPPPPPVQTPPTAKTLRVTTRAVQVSVIAHDKDGRPITGLTKNDFTIFDNGVPQKIASFAQQSSRVTADVRSAPTSVPEHVFSNRLEQKSSVPPSVTVILLDTINTDFHDMASARAQVVKFLLQIELQDRIALYALTQKLIVLHDFTSDTSVLLRALGKVEKTDQGSTAQLEQSTALGSAIAEAQNGGHSDGNAGIFLQGLEREHVSDLTNTVDEAAAAFKAIAQHLASLPGRKNLVWVSGSFPFRLDWKPGSISDAKSFDSQITEASQALSDANVAIYPVDARGLLAPGLPVAMNRPSQPPPATLDSLQALAQRTGGLAFYNTNDIGGAIRRAMDDASLTYEIGYYPTNDKWDGRFREIKVEVKRPGVHLRYRNGYIASPAEQRTPESGGRLLTAAARNPLEATELGLSVHVDAVDSTGGRQLKAEVRVDPTQMHFELNSGHWTDNVEVAWIELDADGKDVGHAARTLKLNISDQSHDKVSREGLVFNETIGLVKEAVELRLVARDIGTGSVGSVNIPFTRLFASATTATTPKN
jgi:VWFA-related protein